MAVPTDCPQTSDKLDRIQRKASEISLRSPF